MTDFVNGVNLLDVEDEIELHNLLDQTEDIDDRKRVRNRLREVMAIHREQREEMRNRREQERENLLRKKVADADEQKRRTLAMYDAMAKSAPAGGNKTLDVNILRTGEDDDFASDEDNSMKEKENALPAANMEVTSSQTSTNSVTTGNSSLFSYWSSKTSSTTTRSSSSKHVQHVFTVASTNTSQNVGIEKLDLIEEAIRARQRNCDETKMRTLAAFDKAARTAPAGSARIVDFNNVTDDDIREKENTPKYTATFEMRGGVPSAKAMAPRIAPRHVEPERDLMEEAIRKRQAESDERKRRTLAAYDQAARSRQAGAPVSVYIPQNFDIEPVVVSLEQPTKPMSPKEKFQQLDATTAPKGGVKTPNAFSLPLPVIRHNAATIKKMILEFCQKHTQEYKESECVVPVAPMARHTPNLARANISIDNFSTSWSNGLAFCALIHHFYPDAFDYEALSPKNRRHNFELAFRVAEEKADIAPLLDVEDMVIMQKPDWKCVFTYVQSFYRRFRDVD